MEIRLHGRGGQGGVTCAKILAVAYGRLGKHVQTFGDYAGERSGAPVRAYTRVSDAPITNRNKVYRPDHVIVLDPHLLGRDTVEGLAPGGILLVNARQGLETFDARFDPFRLAVVDATAIARRHGIGTRTVVIVNTTVAGAFARLDGIPFEQLEEAYRSLGFAGNLAAAREAWDAVRWRAPREAAVAAGARRDTLQPATQLRALPRTSVAEVEPLPAHRESPPTGLATGAWSTQRPRYVENLAPCNAWCPAGNDVVGFVQALVWHDAAAAAGILRKSSPLGGTCGRVCPAPCMAGCNRAEYDGAVHIRGLERWITDRVPPPAAEPVKSGKPARIAIVGGGPAGLSAAYTLALLGHQVVIHERERELGGLLHTGIPSYRLPRDVLRREIEAILALGVEARLGAMLEPDDLRRLARESDALILAVGLQRVQGLRVPGHDLDGVEDGLAFLRRVNLEGPRTLGGHVVVLGGGNTAMDCARSALRCGAERVTVAYRRARAEMPAIREEIEQARQEGVELLLQRQPVAFRGIDRVGSVVLAEVDLGEPDETGRRRPVVSGRVAPLTCDHVLLALGQSADRGLLPAGWELEGGRVLEDGRPLPVFAAGDFGTGDGTVAHAIGSGRRVAGLALAALGRPVEVFERPARERAVAASEIRFDHFERIPPAGELLLAPARCGGTAEVSRGLANGDEARRCFSCGHCTHCDTCLVYCPEGIVSRDGEHYELDATYCKGCGICVHECPRKGMEMVPL